MENLFEFEKNVTGYSIIKYNGDEEKVVIPDTYEGEDVTGIEKSVFEQKSNIKEIILPKTLRRIKKIVFSIVNHWKLLIYQILLNI